MPVRRPLLAVSGAALAGTALLTGCSATQQAAPAAASCPSGSTAHEGACVENALRAAPLSWRDSNQLCLSERRRLPALDELQTFGTGRGAAEWHNLRYRAGTDELAGLVAGDGVVSVAPAAEPHVYRCVAAAQ